MFSFSGVVLGLSLLASASAQATIDVTVGGPNGETVYSPQSVVASPGDHVIFHFNPKNHSVTQSSFNDPCTNLYGGFDSGFHPVPIGQTYGNPTFEVIVKDNNPIWVHCRQAENTAGSHCGKGMVFAVNPGFPGSNNTFAAFQAKALAIGAALSSSAGVSATTTQAIATSTYAASSGAPTIHVTVGGPNGETVYNPTNVVASPGDHVLFHFNPKNHSVTQSSFNDPCTNLYGGFDSGFHPVAIGTTSGNPTFEVIVKDNNPIWVHCRQAENTAGSHCGKGMVFAVNPGFPGSSNTFAAFQAKALAIGAALSSSAGVSATTTQTIATSTYAASSGAPTIHVTVGGPNGETVYNPTNVVASPGDHVLFTFNPKNHSVTQSSFNDPCNNLYGGFDSGFHPVPIGQTYGNPTFEVIVKDNNPIWVHCRQAENTAGSHCGKGMVFAVNAGFPGSSNTFAAFQAKALAVGAALSASAGLSVTTTAAYGSAATPQVVTVTKTVTVEVDAWTTTYAPYPSKTA